MFFKKNFRVEPYKRRQSHVNLPHPSVSSTDSLSPIKNVTPSLHPNEAQMRRGQAGSNTDPPKHNINKDFLQIGRMGQNCMNRIRMFAQETTIHGIWPMIRQDRHWLNRLLWFLAFSICFSACSYFITSSVMRYLSFEVKTTTSIEVVNEIDFPAITFCHENRGKKSIVGTSDVYLKFLTALIVRRRQDFESKYREISKTCKHGDHNVSSAQEDAKRGYNFFRTLGIAKAFSSVVFDSYHTVVKCWLKNQEQNCSEMFLNHMTDHGWCFTFNPHPALVKSFSLGLKHDDTAYGLNDNYKFLKLISSGPHNNVRLLMNIHQDEYCASHHDSAGFQILIHNSRIQPLFILSRSIYLSPGYEAHIGVRLRRNVKLTENLGRCTEFQKLKLYPNATVYFKEACYMECIARNVYKSCNCVPFYGPPHAYMIMAEELKLNSTPVCFTETLCVKDYEYKILENGLSDDCSFCMDPCSNTEYDFHISYSYFPSKIAFAYYQNLTGVNSIERMRDDYLMLDVYLENMLVDVITETQDFPISSLIADMGGQLGFLLGMSVLSLFEFIQFIMPVKRKSIFRKFKADAFKKTNSRIQDIRKIHSRSDYY